MPQPFAWLPGEPAPPPQPDADVDAAQSAIRRHFANLRPQGDAYRSTIVGLLTALMGDNHTRMVSLWAIERLLQQGDLVRETINSPITLIKTEPTWIRKMNLRRPAGSRESSVTQIPVSTECVRASRAFLAEGSGPPAQMPKALPPSESAALEGGEVSRARSAGKGKPDLNSKAQKALAFIRDRPNQKGRTIARHIGVSEETFRKHYLPKLHAYGIRNLGDGYVCVPEAET